METPIRTLKDYRPQHDENCLSRSPFVGIHLAEGSGPCTCGLDALLAAQSAPPVSAEGVEQAITWLKSLQRGWQTQISQGSADGYWDRLKSQVEKAQQVIDLLAAQSAAHRVEVERLTKARDAVLRRAEAAEDDWQHCEAVIALFRGMAHDVNLTDAHVRKAIRVMNFDAHTEADIQRTHKLAAKYGWERASADRLSAEREQP